MEKRLTRSRNRVFGGVAAGLGDYFGIDPVLIRLAFIVLALGGGHGILLYLLLWLLMPERTPGVKHS